MISWTNQRLKNDLKQVLHRVLPGFNTIIINILVIPALDRCHRGLTLVHLKWLWKGESAVLMKGIRPVQLECLDIPVKTSWVWKKTVCYLELGRGLTAHVTTATSAAVYTRTHILNSTQAEGHEHAFCFHSFCSSSNLLASVFLEKDGLRGKRQTAAPRDAWRYGLAAGAANLGPDAGPTLRGKPPAVWHRWDSIELARSLSSLIHVDLISFTIEGEWS